MSDKEISEWWASVDKEIKALIGQPAEQVRQVVESAGWRYRAMQIDGKPRIGTCDVKENRINVSIEKGIITEAWRG